MSNVFESKWIDEIRERYKKRPKFQQPTLYRIAVLPKSEEKRKLIEDWVSCIPLEKQFDVVQRIRNPDLFLATFNELIAGSIIRNCGNSIEYEKPVGNKTPDWYVYPKGDFPEFVVEVATIMPPKHIQDELQAWAELRHRIQKIEHYFHLWISAGPTNGLIGKDIKAIVRFVQNWLGSFDLDTPPENGEVIYQDQDLRILFRLIHRKTTHKRSVEVAGPVFTQWVNSKLLRNRISKKLARYREAKEAHLPLVIALFPTFDSGLGVDSLLDVLFGKEQVAIPTGEVSRDRTGMILPRMQNGQTMLANTRLSAILFVEQSSREEIRILHNPYAQDPIAPELFKGFQHLVIKSKSETHFEMDWASF